MMIIVVEGCAFLLYAILNRQLFPYRSFDEAIHRLASIPEIREEGIPSHKGELRWDDSAVEVIHPYLGFVRDPERSRDTSYLGFPQEKDDPFLRGSSDTLSVAVFGGSFAAGTSIAGESILQSTLGGYGIDARILTLALGGYKQPQQLLLLAYLLSHGAELDVVVNIDDEEFYRGKPKPSLPWILKSLDAKLDKRMYFDRAIPLWKPE